MEGQMRGIHQASQGRAQHGDELVAPVISAISYEQSAMAKTRVLIALVSGFFFFSNQS
jgi:hypothetical protein